jgi:hypothetical protein
MPKHFSPTENGQINQKTLDQNDLRKCEKGAEWCEDGVKPVRTVQKRCENGAKQSNKVRADSRPTGANKKIPAQSGQLTQTIVTPTKPTKTEPGLNRICPDKTRITPDNPGLNPDQSGSTRPATKARLKPT